LIGIGIWIGNKKIEKQITNYEITYADYIYKLHLILECSEYDVFKLAAKENGVAVYVADEHFSRWVKTGELPGYIKEFIDEGKEHIRAHPIKVWTY